VVLGVGTDIVAIKRLEGWHSYSYDQLRKIFSKSELEECKLNNNYDWVRLAARFAAKEAFYKALSTTLVSLGITGSEFSFLFLCNYVYIDKGIWDLPELKIDWKELQNKIGVDLSSLDIKLSLSHEMDFAIAFVVISRNKG
jgi:phosphopantetheine--protein transferase-like protein